MPITLLRVSDFRNISALELSPSDHGLNIISGKNGSGKTSLLEAVHYLSIGRSFRTSTASRLIRHSAEKFSIFAQLSSDSARQIPVGVERSADGTVKSRIAEKDVSTITELASFLPIRVINSQSHHLFESGPVYRRKYLDWGLFYQFDNFLPCWRYFERSLKQRNAALREKRPKREVDSWTDELVKHGLELDKLRREYVSLLAPIIAELAHELLSISHLETKYQPGWDERMEYAAVLANNYSDEHRSGHTQYGPHRADFDIIIAGASAKHFLSRGQQKLLICAMILAQGITLARYVNKELIYLVDDLPSELDLQSREKLVSLLARQKTQIFITAIESESICNLITNKSDVPMKVFHVEHGELRIEERGQITELME